MKFARAFQCLWLAAILAVAGCAEPEGIRVVNEPPEQSPTRPLVPDDKKLYRTLAAMIPADASGKEMSQNWWIFILRGPYDQVSRYEVDFARLIDSIRPQSNEDDPITWSLPTGWTREPATSMRFATLKAPDGKLDVSVSRAGGLVYTNVGRWWGQLWGKEHEKDVTAVNVAEFARQRTIHGRIAFTIDLAGPKNPNEKGPMMGGAMPNPHGGQ